MPAVTYDLLNIIAQGMGPELHWFPEDVSLSRLAAVLVGMANASGGAVLLGISPRSGQIQGIQNVEEMVDRVFQAALLADPPLVLPVPELVPGPYFRAEPGGYESQAANRPDDRTRILRVTVPSGLPYVYNLEGSYLGREGRQTNPLSARKLRSLLIERGSIQFEARVPPEANLADLDPGQVEAYLEALGAQHPLSGFPARTVNGEVGKPAIRPDQAESLLRRGCLQSVNGELRPAYAALLLFGRYPQQWVPNATILAAHFSGLTFADQFIKQELRGTLPELLRQAEAFVRENIRSTVRLVGLAHEETLEYPFDAVRELLVNAVAHRDYNVQGDNIHLNLFADRLEVQSPGGLPGPVTLDNLLKARYSRNPVIVQVLADLGFVERLGYGLDRVLAVLQAHHLRPPRFEEIAGCFRVTLFGSGEAGEGLVGDAKANLAPIDLSVYQGLSLNPRQEAALRYIARYKRITNSAFQELCPAVHPETLRRDLVDLVTRGILIKVGDKKATYYILK